MLNNLKRLNITVKYISKSGFSCSSHAASNSSKKLLSVSMLQLHKTFLSSKMYGWLGIVHWYIVIISAYYSIIIGPIGKDYLFSSIQYGWGYVSFVMIIIKVTIFFDVMIRNEIYCTGATVFVFNFHYK